MIMDDKRYLFNPALEGSDGRISEKRFVEACKKFMEIEEAKKEWKLVQDEGAGWVYMTRTLQRQQKIKGEDKILEFRYDVVYSLCHALPELYFLVYDTEGGLVGVEEVWEMFEIGEDKWGYVTQKDHPLIHQPFFHVHPCNNWEVLRECLKEGEWDSVKYLRCWISLVGGQVGLGISTKYFVQ